jgi:hypothetical protein
MVGDELSGARVLIGGLGLSEGWTGIPGGSILSATLGATWTPYPGVTVPRHNIKNWDVWDPGGCGPKRGNKYVEFILLLYRSGLGSLGTLYSVLQAARKLLGS